jgi:hypothetical protein
MDCYAGDPEPRLLSIPSVTCSPLPPSLPRLIRRARQRNSARQLYAKAGANSIRLRPGQPLPHYDVPKPLRR